MVPAPSSPSQPIAEAKKRSQEQNRKMWAILQQLTPIDWYGNRLSKEEWKWVIVAGLKKTKSVPGIEGGFVILGQETKNMSERDMSEVIEYALWFGNSKGIRFVERG